MNFITTIVGLIGKVISPSKQIQAVGGRRVWVSLVGMAFVIVAWVLKIPEALIYGALAVGGAFVVGESVADVKGRSGFNLADILGLGDDEEETN